MWAEHYQIFKSYKIFKNSLLKYILIKFQVLEIFSKI